MAKCSDIYDKLGCDPGPEFWAKVDELDERLGRATSTPGIGPIQINSACEEFFNSFRELCREAWKSERS